MLRDHLLRRGRQWQSFGEQKMHLPWSDFYSNKARILLPTGSRPGWEDESRKYCRQKRTRGAVGSYRRRHSDTIVDGSQEMDCVKHTGPDDGGTHRLGTNVWLVAQRVLLDPNCERRVHCHHQLPRVCSQRQPAKTEKKIESLPCNRTAMVHNSRHTRSAAPHYKR